MLAHGAKDEWEDLIAACLEGRVKGFRDATKEVQYALLYSQKVSFLKGFIDEAVRRARTAGFGPKSPETAAVLDQAFDLADRIVGPYGQYDKPISSMEEAYTCNQLRLAQAGYIDLEALKNDPPSAPLLGELEAAVVAYLESDWRMPWADRLILKLLLEYEFGAYLHQMLRKDFLDDKERSELQKAQKIARRTGLGQSLKVLFYTVMALAIVVAAALYSADNADPILLIGGGTVLLIGLLWLVAVIIAFVKFGPNAKKNANKKIELVGLAIEKARIFSGDSPISLSDFRRHVEELREAGFVLPQTLFGMLDMLEAEGKTIV